MHGTGKLLHKLCKYYLWQKCFLSYFSQLAVFQIMHGWMKMRTDVAETETGVRSILHLTVAAAEADTLLIASVLVEINQ